MLFVDLHTHSSVSDGVESPTQLMRLAGDVGVTTIAMTDHDTLAGIEEARAEAAVLGIRFIPGVELSVDHNGFKMHMLVYFTEPGEGAIEERLAELRDGRGERNTRIVEKLNELGYNISLEDVAKHAAGPSVGRPHIADALVEQGEFSTRDEVFANLLRDGGAAYVPRLRMTAVEAIELARNVRAVPVIAHPKTIPANRDDFNAIFTELADVGLGGIEAHHPMHDLALREHLTKSARRLGIAATGGSDYHGAEKRTYRIGVGNGDLRVPESAVIQIEEQRDK